MFLKYFIKGGNVPQIDFIENRLFTCDLLYTFQNRNFAVGKVIDNNPRP